MDPAIDTPVIAPEATVTPAQAEAQANAPAAPATGNTLLTDSSDDAPQGEGQANTEAKPEGEDGEKKPDAQAGAPEEYADFTAPDGIALDPEVTGEFKAVAKELNLTQEQAQKLANLGATITQKQAGQTTALLEKARAEWTQAATADKEFGGDALKANMSVARKAMDQFGTPELKSLLNESGLGNHPEVIRFFYRAGKAISEDTFVGGGSSISSAPKSDAEVFYSSTTH